jgi:hypothetical protein
MLSQSVRVFTVVAALFVSGLALALAQTLSRAVTVYLLCAHAATAGSPSRKSWAGPMGPDGCSVPFADSTNLSVQEPVGENTFVLICSSSGH